jgi:hypothetical protein
MILGGADLSKFWCEMVQFVVEWKSKLAGLVEMLVGMAGVGLEFAEGDQDAGG